MTRWEALPRHGVPADQVIADVTALREGDLPTHGGKLFAYVYEAGVPGLDDLQATADALSAHVNGLNPTVFPSLLAMENAIAGAVAGQLGGGPSGVATVVGNMTGGGTESLRLAVKAARDAHPSISGSELVLPSTAHAAFAKAASYLAVRPVPVRVSRQTLRPDPEAVAGAITDRTVRVRLLGTVVRARSDRPGARDRRRGLGSGVRCHVDGCLGGWVLPHLRRLGVEVGAVRLLRDGDHIDFGRCA
jgi:sphinganine-1-phosphate aldolase